MKIHEYQAKQLLKGCGVPIVDGIPAFTPEDARKAAERLKGNLWVVKAQIHAGGRGKAGGVKLAKTLDEVQKHATEILGKTLITPQTGPEGKVVKRLYIEKGSDIGREFYFAMLVDRATEKIKALVSREGGMEIEALAAQDPSAIFTVEIDPLMGIKPYQGRQLAKALGFHGKNMFKLWPLFRGVYETFVKYDASLIEINPLIETQEGQIIALDAKMTFDDNALYRHQEDLLPLRDKNEEDPAEERAIEQDLSYVKLDGNIGCLVNGAGLAMATMDIIKHHGGAPANFLDVGGGATQDRVIEAFKLILADANVEAIFVNIFGGIMRCDVIAEGIVAAAKDAGITVPLVVRLAGTNVERGQQILAQSGLSLRVVNNLEEGAKSVMDAIREAA